MKGSSRLLIVHPPLTEPGPGHKSQSIELHRRLLPHIVYEDFKVIQDIESAMRIIGRDYRTITTDSPVISTSEQGDRIWVCIPRSRLAQESLEEIGAARVAFFFKEAANGECQLEWRKGKNTICICSPLSKYLELSKRPKGVQRWEPDYGAIYAKDYAVLARFKKEKDPGAGSGEYYYHYFIGGIRGLGTWGIGDLMDHHSSKLIQMCKRNTDNDDVQILLEVTYENYRIKNVCDVSDKPQKYFDEQNEYAFIKNVLLKRGNR